MERSNKKLVDSVNPLMLRKAREAMGLSLKEAAPKIGFLDSTISTAAEKLAALEAGKKYPTRSQLLRMSKAYYRPLTVFYMDEFPPEDDRGEDFRISAHVVSAREAGLLSALLRNVRVSQSMVRSILEDEEDRKTLSFVGSMSRDWPIPEAINLIRKTLDLESAENLRRQTKSADDLFKILRKKIEGIGVFVILAGDLGSHHSSIRAEAFHGYASSDEIAPFIVINPASGHVTRSFTLIHELTHIFIGSTGISADLIVDEPDSEKMRVERFCNDVAGEFLLPERFLSGIPLPEGHEEAKRKIADIAREWAISNEIVAYRLRLRTSERISDGLYRKLVADYAERREEIRWWAIGRVASSGSAGPAPSYENELDQQIAPPRHYIDIDVAHKQREDRLAARHAARSRKRFGNALVALVGRALQEEKLTHTKAARILNVKAGDVETLLRGTGPLASEGEKHALPA